MIAVALTAAEYESLLAGDWVDIGPVPFHDDGFETSWPERGDRIAVVVDDVPTGLVTLTGVGCHIGTGEHRIMAGPVASLDGIDVAPQPPRPRVWGMRSDVD